MPHSASAAATPCWASRPIQTALSAARQRPARPRSPPQSPPPLPASAAPTPSRACNPTASALSAAHPSSALPAGRPPPLQRPRVHQQAPRGRAPGVLVQAQRHRADGGRDLIPAQQRSAPSPASMAWASSELSSPSCAAGGSSPGPTSASLSHQQDRAPPHRPRLSRHHPGHRRARWSPSPPTSLPGLNRRPLPDLHSDLPDDGRGVSLPALLYLRWLAPRIPDGSIFFRAQGAPRPPGQLHRRCHPGNRVRRHHRRRLRRGLFHRDAVPCRRRRQRGRRSHVLPPLFSPPQQPSAYRTIPGPVSGRRTLPPMNDLPRARRHSVHPVRPAPPRHPHRRCLPQAPHTRCRTSGAPEGPHRHHCAHLPPRRNAIKPEPPKKPWPPHAAALPTPPFSPA